MGNTLDYTLARVVRMCLRHRLVAARQLANTFKLAPPGDPKLTSPTPLEPNDPAQYRAFGPRCRRRALS